MIYYDLLSMAGKRNYRSAIEFAVKSPVAKPVLEVLAKAPIRSYFVLKQLMQIFKAPERQAAAFEWIAFNVDTRVHSMAYIRSGLRLVKLLSLLKGEDKALHLVLCQPWGATVDCSDTYFNLKRERRRLFWRTRLKPKEIHDWLVKEFNKQVTENVLFYEGAKGGHRPAPCGGYTGRRLLSGYRQPHPQEMGLWIPQLRGHLPGKGRKAQHGHRRIFRKRKTACLH